MTDKMLQNFFDMLDGEWSFVRDISGITPATATGTARFIRHSPHEYDFREDGIIKLNSGEKLQFFRNYIYRLTESHLDVLYGDGPQQGQHYQSYRYDSDFDRLQSIEEHQCSDDCYKGTYHLISDDTFTLETIVTGPKKDYTIRTIFMRKPQI